MSAPTVRAPSQDIAAAARDVVERIILGASALPRRVDVTPLLDALEKVTNALGRLEASRVDQLDHIERFDHAITALGAARALLDEVSAPPPQSRDDIARLLLESVGARLPPRSIRVSASSAVELVRSLGDVEAAIRDAKSSAVDGLIQASGRLLFRAAPPITSGAAATRLFRAGVGVPALHHVDEPVELLVLRLGHADDDEDDAYSEGAVVSRSSHEIQLLGAFGEVTQLRSLARDCMDDVAVLGHLRTVPEGMPWSGALASFDQRLLDNVDALLSLARTPSDASEEVRGLRVVHDLQRWAADAPVPDPTRAFAQALVLGSIDGEDAARAATVALRTAHPSTLAAQRDALALAPNPRIGLALRRLLSVVDAPHIAVALDILRLRREADYPSVVLLLDHPDVLVREAAARCLGSVLPRENAIAALLHALSLEDDARVALAIARSLVLAGEVSGLTYARETIAADLETPGSISRTARLGLLHLLGVAASAADAEILQRSLGRSPDEAAALGWHGHPGHVEPLVAALEADERRGASSPLRVALCAALRRITGGLLPEPDEMGGGPDGDPRDATFPASLFRAFWEQKKGEFATVQRYRFGSPYTLHLSLDELERDGIPIEIREELAFEVAVALRESPLFVHDWIARQRNELARLRELVGEGSSGEWPSARLRRWRA